MVPGMSSSGCASGWATASPDRRWTVFSVSACGLPRRSPCCSPTTCFHGPSCGWLSPARHASSSERPNQADRRSLTSRHPLSTEAHPMSCCGQKRQAPRPPAYEMTARRLPPPLLNPRPITYVGGPAFVVKGAATGLTYLFTQSEPLDVDERDLPALV